MIGTRKPVMEQQHRVGVTVARRASSQQDWLDSNGRMRGLRETLADGATGMSLRRLAEAFGLSNAQYSLLETGQRGWSVKSFAQVAGGLLGTLETITRHRWTLHSIFTEVKVLPAPGIFPQSSANGSIHSSQRSPRPLHPTLTAPLAPPQTLPHPTDADPLATLAPAPAYTWQLQTLCSQLSAACTQPMSIARLAREVAVAEGQPEQAHNLDNILRRIADGSSTGSLATLLRLYAFAAPLLSAPSAPLLLDDILRIARWTLVAPPTLTKLAEA